MNSGKRGLGAAWACAATAIMLTALAGCATTAEPDNPQSSGQSVDAVAPSSHRQLDPPNAADDHQDAQPTAAVQEVEDVPDDYGPDHYGLGPGGQVAGDGPGDGVVPRGATSQTHPANFNEWLEYSYSPEYTDSRLHVRLSVPEVASPGTAETMGVSAPDGYHVVHLPLELSINDSSGWLRREIGDDTLARWVHVSYQSSSAADSPSDVVLEDKSALSSITASDLGDGTVTAGHYVMVVPNDTDGTTGVWRIDSFSQTHWVHAGSAQAGDGQAETQSDSLCYDTIGKENLAAILGASDPTEILGHGGDPEWEDGELGCYFFVERERGTPRIHINYGFKAGIIAPDCTDRPLVTDSLGFQEGVVDGLRYSGVDGGDSAPTGYMAQECNRPEGEPRFAVSIVGPFGEAYDPEIGLRALRDAIDHRQEWDSLFASIRG